MISSDRLGRAEKGKINSFATDDRLDRCKTYHEVWLKEMLPHWVGFLPEKLGLLLARPLIDPVQLAHGGRFYLGMRAVHFDHFFQVGNRFVVLVFDMKDEGPVVKRH